MKQLDFNCADFANAIKAIVKFTGYKQSKRVPDRCALLSFRTSGLLDLTLDGSQAGDALAGYEFTSFRAMGFEQDTDTVLAIPMEALIKINKQIRKSNHGSVTLMVDSDEQIELFLTDSKAGTVVDTCRDSSRVLTESLHKEIGELAKSKYKVEIQQGGVLVRPLEVGLTGAETDKKIKAAQNRPYSKLVLLDVGVKRSFVVGTNGRKMAVAELAVNGRPVLTSNTPVKFLLPIQVANGLVSLLQQEMTSTVHFFYTDEKILIVVEAKSQGAGRYVIVVTRDEHGAVWEFPKWQSVIPDELYTNRTVAEVASGSLLLSLNSIANVATHYANNQCKIEILKGQVVISAKKNEDDEVVTAQAVTAYITGQTPASMLVNLSYIKDSLAFLTDNQGKVYVSIGKENDPIVVFSGSNKLVVAAVSSGRTGTADVKKQESSSGVSIQVVKAD